MARRQWTQFSLTDMAAGLLLFAGALVLNARLVLREAAVRWSPLTMVLLALAALHSAGIFSFYFLLSEGEEGCRCQSREFRDVSSDVAVVCSAAGTMVCCIVAGMSLALAAAARGAGGLFWGGAALASCAALAMLGLAHHTGQGFWARLTQQKPLQIAIWEAVLGWLPGGADAVWLGGGVLPRLLRNGLPVAALAAVMGRAHAQFAADGRGSRQRCVQAAL